MDRNPGDEDVLDLSRSVGESLRSAKATLAVAESSTGGLVGSLLTDVPGSSDYFDRSLVTYSNEAKIQLLSVERSTIEQYGAVSEQTAREMARGVCDNAGSAVGLSTTGVAGPGGGTERTPVGTIYVGIATGDDHAAVGVQHYVFDGSRLENKAAFARQALADVQAALDNDR